MLSPLFIDTFLLDYHLGHVILLGFVVSLLATVPLKSLKVIASVFAGFGTIFLVARTRRCRRRTSSRAFR